MVANQMVARKLSVRDAEKLVNHGGASAQTMAKPAAPATKSRDVVRIEEQLADHLSAAVELRMNKKKRGAGAQPQAGEIAIAFNSLDELEGVLQRIQGSSREQG